MHIALDARGVLFSFVTPAVGSVQLQQVLVGGSDQGKSSRIRATVARDEMCRISQQCSKASGSDFQGLLRAIHKYLPYAVAMAEQVHSTPNFNVPTSFCFQYVSALEHDNSIYELALFSDELASVYFLYGLALYQAAEAALQGEYHSDGSLVPTAAGDDPFKVATVLLKKASSVFSFLETHVLVLAYAQTEKRQLELHVPVCSALTKLSLAHVQELMLSTAMRRGKSLQTLTKLARGLVQQFEQVRAALEQLDDHLQRKVRLAFRYFITLKKELYEAVWLGLLAQQRMEQGKCGHSLSLLKRSLAVLQGMRFTDDTNAALLALGKQVTQMKTHLNVAIEKATKDNETVYFQLVPSPDDQTVLNEADEAHVFLPRLESFEPFEAIRETFFK